MSGRLSEKKLPGLYASQYAGLEAAAIENATMRQPTDEKLTDGSTLEEQPVTPEPTATQVMSGVAKPPSIC